MVDWIQLDWKIDKILNVQKFPNYNFINTFSLIKQFVWFYDHITYNTFLMVWLNSIGLKNK